MTKTTREYMSEQEYHAAATELRRKFDEEPEEITFVYIDTEGKAWWVHWHDSGLWLSRWQQEYDCWALLKPIELDDALDVLSLAQSDRMAALYHDAHARWEANNQGSGFLEMRPNEIRVGAGPRHSRRSQ